MWIIYIYLGVVIANFILFTLNTLKSTHLFETRYPNLKIPKSHWSDQILTVIQLLIYAALPIMNLILAYTLLFKSDEVCERVCTKSAEKCEENKV